MSKGGGVNIPSDYTIKLGSDGSTIHVDSDLDNIHLKEIAPVTINSNVAVTQPIVTQSTSKSDSTASVDLKVEPLKVSSDSTSEIDVKPLAIDSCQTLKLAPLPPIKMEQPYSQHFGITFMGMELWGFNVSGKSETFLHSPTKPQHYSVQIPEPCDSRGEPAHKPQPASVQPRSGLRVRVK
ncbi:MAG: hypothetical protein ACRD5Z_24955 [Bryobacteraceae bacterium]